jgi:hypothetical protein
MGKKLVKSSKLIGGNQNRASSGKQIKAHPQHEPELLKYVKKTEESHKGSDFHGELSRPQKIFHKTVQEWIEKERKFWSKDDMFGDIESPEKIESNLHLEFGEYTFHDSNSVSVDSELYECLNYGYGDYGVAKDLQPLIDKKLKAAGYYMENIDGSTWAFVKD